MGFFFTKNKGLMAFLAFFVMNAKATPLTTQEYVEAQYQKGVESLRLQDYVTAMACFQSMADKDSEGDYSLKSHHHLGVCLTALGRPKEAYFSFKKASDAGYEPSTLSLKKMNLLDILLSDELIEHVASFLSLSDLNRFAKTSRGHHQIFIDLLSRTNFITSKNPFAKDVLSFFNGVFISPPPESIRMGISKVVDKGEAAIHFRDTKHLRDIVRRVPIVRRNPSNERLYFVKDSHAKDYEEIKALRGTVSSEWFFYVVKDKPLILSGTLMLPLNIHFPRGSDIKSLNLKGKSYSAGSLSTKKEGMELAEALGSFDPVLLKIRTSDARKLMESQRQSREKSPELYPSFKELCPYMLICADDLEEKQSDYIASEEPLIYKAPNLPSINSLYQELDDFNKAISYVDVFSSESGIYSKAPLYLQKALHLKSPGALSMAGYALMPDHSIVISGKNMFLIGTILKSKRDIAISGGTLDIRAYSFLDNKPDDMPHEHWEKIRSFMFWAN